MIIQTQIFDNILSVEEQDILLEFMESDYKNWTFLPYISLDEKDAKIAIDEGILKQFPAYTFDITKSNSLKYENIFNILKKIESNVCKNIGVKFQQNYRYKLNCQPPIDNYTIDELYKNIHYDRQTQHMVILYYVNDSDGDTLLFKNKRGHDAPANNKTKKECQDGIFDNVEIIQSITPKKGRAVIFDGTSLHTAGWSNTQNRYAVNLNIILENNKKTNLI
jgi:hypothetical protein